MGKSKNNGSEPIANSVRREKSMDTVLRSAERLFVKKGFAGAKVEDIAKAAKVTTGTVYFYFQSKENLLLNLLDKSERRVLDPAVDVLHREDLSVSDKLVRYLHHWAQPDSRFRVTMFLHVLMSFEFQNRGGPVEKRIDGMYNRLYDELTRMFETGQLSGEIYAHAPPREQAATLISLMDGALLEWLRRGKTLDGESFVKNLRQMLLLGLVRTAAR